MRAARAGARAGSADRRAGRPSRESARRAPRRAGRRSPRAHRRAWRHPPRGRTAGRARARPPRAPDRPPRRCRPRRADRADPRAARDRVRQPARWLSPGSPSNSGTTSRKARAFPSASSSAAPTGMSVRSQLTMRRPPRYSIPCSHPITCARSAGRARSIASPVPAGNCSRIRRSPSSNSRSPSVAPAEIASAPAASSRIGTSESAASSDRQTQASPARATASTVSGATPAAVASARRVKRSSYCAPQSPKSAPDSGRAQPVLHDLLLVRLPQIELAGHDPHELTAVLVDDDRRIHGQAVVQEAASPASTPPRPSRMYPAARASARRPRRADRRTPPRSRC